MASSAAAVRRGLESRMLEERGGHLGRVFRCRKNAQEARTWLLVSKSSPENDVEAELLFSFWYFLPRGQISASRFGWRESRVCLRARLSVCSDVCGVACHSNGPAGQ